MDNGQVVESGTHRELLSHNGKYADLINSDKIELYSALDEQNSPLLPQPVELLPGESNPEFIKFEKPVPPAKIPESSYEIFKRLLEFLNGTWKWVALSVLLGVVTIGANIGLMATSAFLLSSAALHPSIADLQIAIVGVRFFGIARGVFRYLERLASHTVSFRLLARLRVWFYSALEPLAPARLMTFGSGDLLSRIVGDVNTLENFYVRIISPPMVAIIVTAGMGLFLASYDPVLGWALIAFLLLLGLIVPIVTRAVSRNPGREWVLNRAELQNHLVEAIQGMADVVAFGRQKDKEKQLRSTGNRFKVAQMRLAMISGANSGLSVLLSNLGMWLVLFLAIPLVGSGKIPGVLLATITLAALASFEAVTPLPLAAQMFGSSLEAAKRLFEMVDAKPSVEDKVDALKITGTDFGVVEFKNVSFHYEGSDVEGLKGVDFKLKEGKSLAVVGPSGAGKSTILQLLQRFWEFDSGEITIFSRSIRSFDQDDIRKLYAVVSQNPFFFNSTIQQNLLLANPSASQELIDSAAGQAQINDFISRLPSGYQTWIGEFGARLSGGELQRLAIARALLKNAPILLLDEPTANLDPITERAVLETLWKLMEKRTTLIATHRLVGLDHFDEILVLDKGRIVERGTHSFLLKQGGLYGKLWNLQNQVILAEH
jgi:ATP-binding cassette, subfamily C, bacterial CydC